MSQLTTVVFAGPTLYGWKPGKVPAGWVFHPSACLGDLLRAADAGARRVVLIDGRFIEAFPPSPAEVLALVRAGIDVWGAASLGALRAVELERYGMRGHGWVFRQYRRRRLFADDEVMVVYDDETGRPLSEALVKLRYALMRLRGLIPGSARRRILRDMQALYFPERTRERIRACVAAHAGRGVARAFMAAYVRLDIKQRDAVTLLERLRAGDGP